MKKQKNYSVETLRGVAIILVVMGHVIGSGADGGMKVAEDSGWRHLYFTFAYLRMPLFTVISGWVYALFPVTIEKYWDFTIKKVRRIILPMIFVGTAYFLLQYIVPGTNKTGVLSEIWQIYVFPYTLYWYLPSLFLVFVVVGVLDSYRQLSDFNRWLFFTVLAFVLLLVRDMIIPETAPNYFSYKGAVYLFPFFLIGVGLQRFNNVFSNRYLTAVLMVLFFAGLLIQQLGWYEIIQYNLDKKSGMGLIIGLSGTILLFKLKWKIGWLIYFGNFAYSIYLFHSFGTAAGRIVLNRFGITYDVLVFFISLIVGMVLPIIAEKVFERFGLTRMLFLGRSFKDTRKKKPVPLPVEKLT
jgi:glucans biosynthesis protein C